MTLVNVSTGVPTGEGGRLELYLPLGCLYLVSALERAGIDVEFRDYQLYARDLPYQLGIESFQSFLAGSSRILGISCMVSMLPFVLLGTKRFKESHPDHTIILGGPGPSGVAEAIMESMPWIDGVGRGEGEVTLVEVVRALRCGESLASIPGITHRDGSGVRRNPRRERIRDLDCLPFPAYDRVDMGSYSNISIVSGRGCPYRCAFCDVGPLWDNRTCFRSIENVIAELDLLKNRYGQSRVNVADDTFDLRRDRAEDFCREVGGLGIRWTCLARVDLMDDSLLDRMAKAGCDAVFLGIESGSDAVLAKINKRFTIREATEKAELATRYMKKVITSYIWGFPFETMDDFKSTIFSVVSMWHLGAMAGLKLLSPMPLSRLGIECRDRLDFHEDLCSVFASLGNIAPSGSSRKTALPEEFKAIIKQHPDIFAGFHYIKHEGIEEKARYLARFNEKYKIEI